MQQSEIFESLRLKFPQVSLEEAGSAVLVPKGSLLDIVSYLKSGELAFDNLHCITAVDRKEKIELIYIFYGTGKYKTLSQPLKLHQESSESRQRRDEVSCSLKEYHQVILKIYLSLDNPEVESLTKFYRSADWLEREVYDLFGVKFLNHPDLRRILNPDDWKGYPLRKDYAHPDMIKKTEY